MKAVASSIHWDHESTWPRCPALSPCPRRSTAYVAIWNAAIPRANRSYRPLCSPSPCTTANVIFAVGSSHARNASLVPSEELIEPCAATALSGAKVAHEDRDDQGVGLVAGHLHKAGRAQVPTHLVLEVTEELHLEETTRLGAGDPRLAASPDARVRKHVELLVETLQPVVGQPIEPVVKNPGHDGT